MLHRYILLKKHNARTIIIVRGSNYIKYSLKGVENRDIYVCIYIYFIISGPEYYILQIYAHHNYICHSLCRHTPIYSERCNF